MSAPTARRGFLRGLVLVSATAGAGALTSKAFAAPAAHPDQALLAAGRELDTALVRYGSLVEDLAWRIVDFESLRPDIPPEIIRRAPVHPFTEPLFYGDYPRDWRGASDRARLKVSERILEPYEAKRLVEGTDGRTVRGKLFRRLWRECEAYHEAEEAARVKSGVGKAEEARFYAGRDVLKITFAIAEIPATTLAGLAVKGRAGQAMQRVWGDEGDCMKPESTYAKLLANLVALDAREVA